MMKRTVAFLVIAIFAILGGCQNGPEKTPVISIAFVGPLKLELRQDLGPKSPVVGTASHGEKVEIIQIRRRFNRIRTKAGIEGWTDQERLLSAEQVEMLGVLQQYAAGVPSQGAATVNEPLNMHTVPNRFSPSFSLIEPGDVVQVLQRKVVDRVAYKLPQPEKKAAPPPPKKKRKKGEKAEPTPTVSDLKAPQPPPAPPNWQELSYNYRSKQTLRIGSSTQETPKDSWTLVRAKDGKAGWVMFRLLYMQIPDEVCQLRAWTEDPVQSAWHQFVGEFVADVRGEGYSGYPTFRDGWVANTIIDSVRSGQGWTAMSEYSNDQD